MDRASRRRYIAIHCERDNAMFARMTPAEAMLSFAVSPHRGPVWILRNLK